MINFAENLNKMITAGLGGETEAPRTEIAVGHRLQYLDASGPVASFETNIVAPLRKLMVNMLPIQAGSGDPSPENIRPITGFDAVTVMWSGVNLISKDIVRGYPDNTNTALDSKRKFTPNTFVVGMASNNYYRSTSITDFSYENGVLTFTNQASGCGIGLPLIVKGGYQYKFSATFDIYCRAMFYDADGNFLGYQDATNATVTAPDDAVCCVFCLLKTAVGTFTVSDIMVTYGSTAQTYVDGNAEYITFPLGDTVYGGTLDVSTGKLIVTHGEIASYNGEVLPGEWISDRDVYAAGTTPTIGAQVVYVLDTPQTIDLEPQQITTLIGDNNVWSDAGDLDVTYTYYEETEGY